MLTQNGCATFCREKINWGKLKFTIKSRNNLITIRVWIQVATKPVGGGLPDANPNCFIVPI
jgi:hypothetical protein